MALIKLKYLGFVIGGILLVTGWIIQFLSSALSVETLLGIHTLILFKAIAIASIVFIFGGILFYGFISSKEDDSETPKAPLTPVQQKEEEEAQALEETAFVVKNSIPFTMVYGGISILITLMSGNIFLFHHDAKIFALIGLLVGLLANQYYIRKLIRQFKWLNQYKKQKS